MSPLNTADLGNDQKVTIKICGDDVQVDQDDEIASTLKNILEAKGIDSFGIIVDGKEISTTSDLPDTFSNHAVEVYRSAKVG